LRIIRGFTAAASVTFVDNWPGCPSTPVFRGFTAAASLKGRLVEYSGRFSAAVHRDRSFQ